MTKTGRRRRHRNLRPRREQQRHLPDGQRRTTTFNYDRNRLLTATAGRRDVAYNYDPFGRLDTVTAARHSHRAQRLRRLRPHRREPQDHRRQPRRPPGTPTTRWTAPSSKTTDAGTAEREDHHFNYLGLSDEVLTRRSPAAVTKSYQYSPWGERLSQVKHNAGGTEEDALLRLQPAHRRRDAHRRGRRHQGHLRLHRLRQQRRAPSSPASTSPTRPTRPRSRTTPTGSTPSAGTRPPAPTTWASATTAPA